MHGVIIRSMHGATTNFSPSPKQVHSPSLSLFSLSLSFFLFLSLLLWSLGEYASICDFSFSFQKWQWIIGYVTFALIKPDTLCEPSQVDSAAGLYKYGANLRSDMESRLHAIFQSINESFTIEMARPLWFTESQVDRFYSEHISQPYYGKLRSLMISCPSVSLLLRSETPNAVGRWREKIGPTNSEKARVLSPTSLRARYGADGTANAFHGSDSVTSALREMEMLFFDPNFDFL